MMRTIYKSSLDVHGPPQSPSPRRFVFAVAELMVDDMAIVNLLSDSNSSYHFKRILKEASDMSIGNKLVCSSAILDKDKLESGAGNAETNFERQEYLAEFGATKPVANAEYLLPVMSITRGVTCPLRGYTLRDKQP